MNTIYKVCGGRWGGTKVDESFLKLLNQVIGSENVKHFKNEGRSEFLEFLRGFELKKEDVQQRFDEKSCPWIFCQKKAAKNLKKNSKHYNKIKHFHSVETS